jgi:hypothetical protein
MAGAGESPRVHKGLSSSNSGCPKTACQLAAKRRALRPIPARPGSSPARPAGSGSTCCWLQNAGAATGVPAPSESTGPGAQGQGCRPHTPLRPLTGARPRTSRRHLSAAGSPDSDGWPSTRPSYALPGGGSDRTTTVRKSRGSPSGQLGFCGRFVSHDPILSRLAAQKADPLCAPSLASVS